MILDRNSSDRLSILRFPLIIGVIFIHASGSNVNFQNGNSGAREISAMAQFVQDFISHGIARIAVPLFFMISGYLFFLGFRWSFEKYKSKLKSRTASLIIPFVFWNIVTMTALLIAQSIPSLSVYFSGSSKPISTYSLFDFVNNLIGLNKSPISYQFWFIRDLIAMVLIAPIIAFLLKNRYVATITVITLFFSWYLDVWYVYVPSVAAFFFFYCGAYCSSIKLNLFVVDQFGKTVTLLYLAILLLDTATKMKAYNLYIHNIGILFGITTALYISNFALKNMAVKRTMLKLSVYSFFVFAVHEPVLTVFKKVVYKIFTPTSDFMITIIYFFSPCLIILLALIGYKVLHMFIPKTLSIVTGGR